MTRSLLGKTHEVDLFLALIGFATGVFLTVGGTAFPDYGLALAISCGGYLALRSRLRKDLREPSLRFPSPISIIPATLLFFGLLVIAVFLLGLTIYGRLWPFFLLASMMSGVVAFEVLSFPLSRNAKSLILIQVLSLFLIFRLSLFQQFPASMLGVDPWYHLCLITQISSLGTVPLYSRYSGFPGMHLIVVILSEIAKFDLQTSFILILMGFEIVGILFVFLLGNCIAGTPIALLSTLLLTVLQTSIRWGWWLTPTTIGLSIMLAILYVVLQKRPQANIGFKLISILLLFSLVLIHPLSTLVVFGAMTALYIALHLWNSKFSDSPSSIVLSPILIVLFLVTFASYWAYAQAETLVNQPFIGEALWYLQFGFRPQLRIDIGIVPDLPDIILTRIGAAAVLGLAVFGLLSMMRVRNSSWKKLSLALCGLALMGITFATQVMNLVELEPGRWVGFAQFSTIVPAGVAVYSLTLLVRRFGARRIFLMVLISSIALLNVMAPEASFDSPLANHNNSYRYALLSSEMAGADFITHVYSGHILTDYYFKFYTALCEKNANDLSSEDVNARYFKDAGLLLLRKYDVSEGLFVYTSRATGLMQLPINYENQLGSDPQMNIVYSSPTVTAYLPS